MIVKQLLSIMSILIAFNSVSLYAESEQELFLRANKHYDYKEFSQALETYQSMHNKGRVVWYNMGNSAYQLGNYTDAFIYWKRAQHGAHGELYTNSKYNVNALYTKIGRVPEQVTLLQSMIELFKDCVAWFSTGTLQLLFLMGWIFIIFLGISYKRHARYGILLLVLAMMNSVLGVLLVVKYSESVRRTAVITQETVSLFAGPDEQYHVVGSLNNLAYVTIVQEHDSWYKIKHQQLIGWLPTDKLVVI